MTLNDVTYIHWINIAQHFTLMSCFVNLELSSKKNLQCYF